MKLDKGKLTQRQASDIAKKLSELNVESEQDIRDFIDYVDNVFLKSDKYAKIDESDKLSKKLKALTKDKSKDNKVVAVARKLAAIDPSKVKDIDKHIQVLNDAIDGLKGTTIETKAGDKTIVGRKPMSIEETSKYIDEQAAYEFEEAKKEYKEVFGFEPEDDFDASYVKQKIAEMRSARSIYKKLTGKDAGNMSLEKISEKIFEESENETVEDKFTEDYQQVAEIMLNDSKASAEEVLSSGINPLTGEPLSQRVIDIVNSVIGFEVKELSTKEIVNLINRLDNFSKNGVVGGMGDIASKINGNRMAIKLDNSGKHAFEFKRYFSNKLGSAIGRYLTNPRLIVDEIFRGVESGEKFWKASGLRGFQNGKAKGIKKASVVLDEFESFKTDDSFMDIENIYERAMWAHVKREVGNDFSEIDTNFSKVKDWMKQSYENLMNSSDSDDVKKGKYYKKVYDKLLKDSNSIQDAESKVNDTNLNAVDVYTRAFASEYDNTKFTMDAYFNKDFRQDNGYSFPVRFGNVDFSIGVDVTDTYFGSNKNVNLRKKAGSMNEDVRSKSLGSKYIDLDFDRIAHQEFEKVAIANEVTPFTTQYQSFKNTKEFGSIIKEEGTRSLVVTTLDDYIKISQGVNTDKFEREWQGLNGVFNRLGRTAIAQSLIGVTQPLKQVIPMIPSTLINSGQFDYTVIGNKDYIDFLSKSGRSTSIRGLGSLVSFDAAAEALKANKEGFYGKAIQWFDKKNDWALEKTLKNSDSFIANISWASYYQQKNGKVSDWSKEDINEDAANYADSMVEADQGASDPDLVGEVFRKKGLAGGLLKMALPLARFSMNTKANLTKNTVIAFSKHTSNQERAAAFRGISASMAQLYVFKSLSQGISFLILEAAKAGFGEDDEENESEKMKKLNKMAEDKKTSNMYLELIGRPLVDALSPVPATDELLIEMINIASSLMDSETPEDFKPKLIAYNNTTWGSGFGLASITLDNVLKAAKSTGTANTGQVKGKGVQTKTAQEYATPLLGFLWLSALLGTGTTETTSFARKSINMTAKTPESIRRAYKKGTKARDYIEQQKVEAKEEKKETKSVIKNFLKKYGL